MGIQKRSAKFGVAAIAVITMLGAATAGLAAEGERLTVTELEQMVPSAELEDIATYAEDDPRGYEPVLREMWWQGDILRLAIELRDSHPGYLGYEIDWGAQGVTWFFAGTAPVVETGDPAVDEAVSYTVVDHVGRTSDEFNDDVRALVDNLSERLPAESFKASVYQTRGSADFTLSSDLTEQQRRDAQELIATVEGASSETGEVSPLVLEVSYGGAILMEPSDTTPADCTSAFPAAYGGDTGHTTAAHCNDFPDDRHKNNCTNCTGFTATTQTSNYGYWGDWQFYTTTSPAVDKFYYTSNSNLRNIYASGAWPGVGARVCHFGQKSNANNCADVTDRHKLNTDSVGTIVLDENFLTGGDSGGPYYYGTTVYGIHTGNTKDSSGVYQDAFAATEWATAHGSIAFNL